MIITVIILLCIVLAGYIVVKSSYVQTRLAKWVASEMTSRLGARVDLERLDIDFFNKVTLEGFIMYDQEGDTLAAASSLYLTIKKFSLRNDAYRFGELTLTNADIRIRQRSPEGALNVDFISKYFGSSTPADTLSSSPISLDVGELRLENARFSYYNPYADPLEEGLDFANIDVRNLNATVGDFQLINDTVRSDIQSFSFTDRSGFKLENLQAEMEIIPEKVLLQSLILDLGESVVRGDLAFKHESWSDYSDFVNAVEIDADLSPTDLNFQEIGYFAPQLFGLDFPFTFEGNFSGTISNLKGRKIMVALGERSVFRGDVDLLGLPDIDATFMDFRIKQLSSDYADLQTIGARLADKTSLFNSLPSELERAGSLFFEGSFTGFTKDFVAYGGLTTEAGRLDLDLNLKNDSLNNQLIYTGGIEARRFDVGHILGIPELGSVTAEAEVRAISRAQFVSSSLKGKINQLVYAGYAYEDITVDGDISKNTFEGRLQSKDPNLHFNFDGVVDFAGSIPLFNFDAQIYNIDLSALNLVGADDSLSFSSNLTLNGRGNRLNNMSGTLSAEKSFLCYGDSAVYIESILLSAGGDDRGRKISLTSDIMDLSITGIFEPEELGKGFQHMISEVLPSIYQFDVDETVGPQIFDFSLNYKAPNAVSNLLIPGLNISPNTTIYGSVDNQKSTFGIFARTDSASYKNLAFHGLVVDAGKISEVMKAKVHLSEFVVNGYAIQNPDIDVEAYNDIVEVGMGWLNAENASYGDFDMQLTFIDTANFVVQMKSGNIGTYGSVWELTRPAQVWVAGDSIAVDSLILAKHEQVLAVSGTISRNPESELLVNLQNFNLADIDSLGFNTETKLSGILNLQGSVSNVYAEPLLRASADIENLAIDGFELGNITATSEYVQTGLALNGSLNRSGKKLLDFKGDYLIGQEEPLDGTLTLDQFDLDLVNVLGLKDVRDISGFADGEIQVEGTLKEPRLKGIIDFAEARFTIDYLNATFIFSDEVRVEDGWLGIDYKPIYDINGNKGFVVASAFHDNFKNWTYDVSADVDNFFILNTSREMNSIYYGTAYATGTVQIGAYEDQLEINIDARTNKGTSIKLPLDESGEVTLENFVYFVEREKIQESSRTADLTGVQMRLNLDVTPDADVQLIFDEQTGDIIRGRGSGVLTFEISPSGEFNMFGRYEIVSGSYLFTLKNLINKQFIVRPGGVIGWYGNPYEADMDITAYYGLRAPLFPIMIENQERYRVREDINVVLNLTDKLLNPNITFEIELPQATENERSQLASVVSTTQQLNQQVFSLLILNRFLPVAVSQNETGSGITGLGSATTSDFVSTQISNWLSEISNDFDVGINYRPGDQISNQEVAVALSTQLFNERLTVRGNFGVTQASELQYTQGQSGLVGDFLLEYMLTEDGKIRLKVFNETNPYENFSTGGAGSIYTQGVGLIYQEDFNTLDEFVNKVGKLFTNDKAEKADS